LFTEERAHRQATDRPARMAAGPQSLKRGGFGAVAAPVCTARGCTPPARHGPRLRSTAGGHPVGKARRRHLPTATSPGPGGVTDSVVTLGLSVTASSAELVVMQGSGARGAVLDRVVIPVQDDPSATESQLRHTVDTVLQTEAIAVSHGYRVHAVGVAIGADELLTNGLIDALECAGLNNVTALDPADAREIFTHPELAVFENSAAADSDRLRVRRRRIFIAALAIALAALAFAIGDQLPADQRTVPHRPAVTPLPAHPAIPDRTPAETRPPSNLTAPPQVSPAPTATSAPQQPPAQREPSTPPSPDRQWPPDRPSLPPAMPADPAEPGPEPSTDCVFLCGVAI